MRSLILLLLLVSSMAIGNEGGGGGSGEGGGGGFVKLEPLTVNLSDGRYIQCVAQAKLGDPLQKEYVTAYMPIIRFELIKALIGQTADAIKSPAFMTTFAEKAKDVINKSVGGDFIKEVFFESWIIQ